MHEEGFPVFPVSVLVQWHKRVCVQVRIYISVAHIFFTMAGGEDNQIVVAAEGNAGAKAMSHNHWEEPKIEVLNTGQIYSKIAASGPYKKSAVRQICQQFMDMSFEQVRQNGGFEMGSMMKIRVHEVPAVAATQKRRAKPAKQKLTITPMVMMKRKILGQRLHIRPYILDAN